jgi:MSHA biogenesis protein MshN
MSVINQMLKDLDKRQEGQTVGSNVVTPTVANNSSIKLFVVAVIIIVLANITGIFAWQLYVENQSLKNQTQQSIAELSQRNLDFTAENIDGRSTIVTKDMEKETSDTKLAKALKSTPSKPIVVTEQASQPIMNNVQVTTATPKQEKTSVEHHSNNVIEQQSSEASIAKLPVLKATNTTESRKPTLTISRRQLSAQGLADKKITQAEQAMEVNDLTKAASLFEEVLLLLPEHETARKQLAALWYGKKAYQDAINLLSQGIALAPQAEEMRLMSARIYFEQGQARQALNLLSPVNNSDKVELQILLASVAAELNEHEVASAAYQKLLLLEPTVGRWWLGLAASFDSQGQFKPASHAYSQAINKGNLSIDAVRFARQRLAELGE